jgi:hypothetical protein
MTEPTYRRILIAATPDLLDLSASVARSLSAKGAIEVVVEWHRPSDQAPAEEEITRAIGACDAVICLVGAGVHVESPDRQVDSSYLCEVLAVQRIAAKLAKPAFVYLSAYPITFDPAGETTLHYAPDRPTLPKSNPLSHDLAGTFRDESELTQHLQGRLFPKEPASTPPARAAEETVDALPPLKGFLPDRPHTEVSGLYPQAPPTMPARPQDSGISMNVGSSAPPPLPDRAKSAREDRSRATSSAPPLVLSPRHEPQCEVQRPHPIVRFVRAIRSGLRQAARVGRNWIPVRSLRTDPVECTVFAPPKVSAGDTFLLQVFAHRPEDSLTARKIAREFDSAARRRGYKTLETAVARGATMAFHLAVPGFFVPEPTHSFVWGGTLETAQFEVDVPAGRAPGTVIGRVVVSVEGVPVALIKFKIEVTAVRELSRGRLFAVGDEVKRFRRAFISYASVDRDEVIKRVQVLRLFKLRFFKDLLNIEPGDRWEKKIYGYIDKSDLFLLFWSTAAQRSEWVLKEIRHALARKQGDDHLPPEIIPVILEGPPPPKPPAELAHLHFNDYLIYFLGKGRKAARS